MNKKIIFLLLLLLYISVIAAVQKDRLWADENRYIDYATNLSKGDYLPHYEDYLWNGPGYPVILAPLVFLKVPLIIMRVLNAVFLFLAVYYFYLALKLYMPDGKALFVSSLYGIYPPFLRYIHLLLTEVLSVFLVSCFLYYFCKLHHEKENKSRNIIVSSLVFGYLALTKIFFGYVLLVLLLFYLLMNIFKRTDALKKTVVVYLCSLIFCTPYLFYTYSVTGKIFYWGNSGGSSLYWMSTPYDEELGDWHGGRQMKKNKQLSEHHQEIFNGLEKYSFTERDKKLKSLAMKNIVGHPLKFIKNWTANVGRLLFNYPYSYTEQKLSTYFYILPNMFIVVFFVVCIYPAFLGRRLIPHEINGLLLFGLISFGGSSLLSAYNRQLWPLVPAFMLWITFIMFNVLKVEVKR